MTAVQLFVEAFNRGDLGSLASLLAPDARTELVGSGFEPEQGPDKIRAGSLTHMLGGNGDPLVAEVAGDDLVLLAQGVDGPIDLAIAIDADGDAIRGLRYHTLWHDRETVAQLAAEAGRELADR